LALGWGVFHRPLLMLIGVQPSVGSAMVARRNAAVFLGLAVLLWLLPTDVPATTRNAIATGLAVAVAGLAGLGLLELACKRAGMWILLAVAVEILLAIGFWACIHP